VGDCESEARLTGRAGKLVVKSWSDGQEVHIKIYKGRTSSARRNPMLPEPFGVNATSAWDEGYRPYPGRPDRYGGNAFFSEPSSYAAMRS